MYKIMFVCYGNICRSPMAEFLFKEFVKDKGETDNFMISSSATSTEELGNGVYYGTRRILDRLNIDYSKKRSVQLKYSDYDKYDYFIGMDERNRIDMKYILKGDPMKKVYCLMDFTSSPRDVADPWYTGDFETTFQDVSVGISEFYKFLQKGKNNHV